MTTNSEILSINDNGNQSSTCNQWLHVGTMPNYGTTGSLMPCPTSCYPSFHQSYTHSHPDSCYPTPLLSHTPSNSDSCYPILPLPIHSQTGVNKITKHQSICITNQRPADSVLHVSRSPLTLWYFPQFFQTDSIILWF